MMISRHREYMIGRVVGGHTVAAAVQVLENSSAGWALSSQPAIKPVSIRPSVQPCSPTSTCKIFIIQISLKISCLPYQRHKEQNYGHRWEVVRDNFGCAQLWAVTAKRATLDFPGADGAKVLTPNFFWQTVCCWPLTNQQTPQPGFYCTSTTLLPSVEGLFDIFVPVHFGHSTVFWWYWAGNALTRVFSQVI